MLVRWPLVLHCDERTCGGFHQQSHLLPGILRSREMNFTLFIFSRTACQERNDLYTLSMVSVGLCMCVCVCVGVFVDRYLQPNLKY